MIPLILFGVLIVSVIQMFIIYNPAVNKLPYIWGLYLTMGLFTALSWFGISRMITDRTQLLSTGVVFDLIVGGVWLIGPLFLFTPNFHLLSWVGFAMMAIGTIFIHVGRFL